MSSVLGDDHIVRRMKDRKTSRSHRPRRVGLIVVASAAVEVAGLWLRARRLGGNVVVRCGQGHLFMTIWIPAASIKAVRLGPWRLQRCPVGHHWSLVTPVNEASLTEDERAQAATHRDIRLP